MPSQASSKHSLPLIHAMPYRFKRYILYVCVAIFTLTLPFIHINGNHIFLLSFMHKELHLLGVVFSVQEFYLMPLLLILLFVVVFFLTTLGGRVWCGWGCPQTIFRTLYRDGIETRLLRIRKRITDKQKHIDSHGFVMKGKRLIALGLFFIVALLASANFLWFFVPPNEFFAALSAPFEHSVLYGFWLAIALFLLFDVTYIAENFCVYVCPYARVQSVLYDDDTIMAMYDVKRGGVVYAPNGSKLPLSPKKHNIANECTNCHACVKICPTHIDIRKGLQLECINCLECVDACTSVMAHYNRPSLVRWISPNALRSHTSVRYMRGKTIGYMVLVVMILVGLVIMGGMKESMLLNIDRNTQSYSIRKSGAVHNDYTFLVENTSTKAHDFAFEILGDDGLHIIQPRDTVFVREGKKRKFVVTITAEHPYNVALEDAELLHEIRIRAYAIDDDGISVERKSVFVYPSARDLRKALAK